MQKIKLTQEKYALVDDQDFEYLNRWKWRINSQGYAVRRVYIGSGMNRISKDIRMHRQIMNEPSGLEIDHIDLNGLNNQRNNLRIATHWQNLANRNIQSNNTSGYKGVSWSKQNKKWWAQIYINSKTISLGFYDDINEAVKVRNKAYKDRYGEFAR